MAGIPRAGLGGVSGLQYQSTADTIAGSVKFNTSGYLERTQSAGNQTTWTWSSWIKVGDLSGNNIFGMEGGYPNIAAFFQTDGKLRFSGSAADVSMILNLVTEPQYRDLNGWYHVVLNYDTGNAEQLDRARIYINGKRVVNLDTTTYPSLNATTEVNNNGNEFRIASHSGVDHLDGYTTTIHFIDGQALGPHFFGFTDPLTNTWKPKKFDAKGTTINDGTTWSNFATGYATPANAFDGNTGTAALYTVADEFVFTPPKPIRGSSLRFYVNTGSGSPIDVSTNGVDFTGTFRLENGAQYSELYEITDGLLTQLRVKTNAGGGGNIYQIWIDGELLVDNTTTNLSFGVNGFHLPMDGSAPVGQDQSGKGNDYTLYNFIGSAGVDKATGALPILGGLSGASANAIVRTDPYASDLILALPLVGDTKDVSNQINSGNTAKVFTANGNAAASSVESNFYGGSFVFDGNGDFLATTSNDYRLGTDDFTIEAWIRPTSLDTSGMSNSIAPIIDYNGSNSTGAWFSLQQKDAGVQFGSNGANNIPALASGLTLGWNHVAVARSGNTTTLYLNGVSTGSFSDTHNYTDSVDRTLYIGKQDYLTRLFTGYIQDVRIYKGAAKYTSNFIPASLDPDIVLDSPSGVSGGGKLAKAADGAVMFDGPTDGASAGTGYLTIPSSDSSDFNFGTGDFTWEAYIYGSDWDGGSSNNDQFVIIHAPSDNNNGSGLYVDGGQSYYYSNKASSRNVITGPILQSKRWYHIAAVRASGTLTMYVNGISVGSASYTDTYADAIFTLGRNEDNNKNQFRGYISNFRVLNSALYTSNFTPPAAPLTNVTNTKLLCCQSKTSSTDAAVTPGAVVANGETPPSHFNPFNADINTVVGKEMGYCTLNPLNFTSATGGTLTNGNLDFKGDTTGSAYNFVASTLSFSSDITDGIYFEVTQTTYGQYAGVALIDGAASVRTFANSSIGGASNPTAGILWANSGATFAYGTDYGNLLTYSASGDVVGVAVKNNKVWFHKNGVYTAGNPNTDTAGTITLGSTKTLTPGAQGFNSNVFSFNFGQKPFKFPPPEGFKPLNTGAVRPESTVMRPDQYVGVATYLGTSANHQINVVSKPDLVIIKGRDGDYDFVWQDTVRGLNKTLTSNRNQEEKTDNDGVLSVNTRGFIVGANTAGFQSDELNNSGKNYVTYCFNAGGNKNTFNVDGVGYASAADAGLTGGDITPTGASVGTKQGFSIITWDTASLSGTKSIATGLTQAPEFVITKVTTTTDDWLTFHKDLSSTESFILNGNRAKLANAAYAHTFNSDGTISGLVVGDPNWWMSDETYVFYSWHSVPGLQKFGSYKGNNNADGTFVELGFRPAVLWVKRSGATGSWYALDNERDKFNNTFRTLSPNQFAQEDVSTGASGYCDFLSNGFKARTTDGSINASDTYMYAAWAEAPTIDLYGGGANAR